MVLPVPPPLFIDFHEHPAVGNTPAKCRSKLYGHCAEQSNSPLLFGMRQAGNTKPKTFFQVQNFGSACREVFFLGGGSNAEQAPFWPSGLASAARPPSSHLVGDFACIVLNGELGEGHLGLGVEGVGAMVIVTLLQKGVIRGLEKTEG